MSKNWFFVFGCRPTNRDDMGMSFEELPDPLNRAVDD